MSKNLDTSESKELKITLEDEIPYHIAITPHESINNKDETTLSQTEYTNLRNKIIKDIISPTYYSDVRSTLSARKKWKSTSNKIETLSKIFAGAATIVAFASGVYDYQYLSFIAGSLGTIGIVFQQFATYASGESKERTNQANQILKYLKIEKIEDLNGDGGDN